MTRLSVQCFVAAVFVLVCLVFGRECQGQVLTGDIQGTVRDSTGAVVPSAQVTLTQVDTGTSFSATTDPSGSYSFAELRPARYSLEVSAPSFEKTAISDITLLVAQHLRLDVTLRAGSMTQRVEVRAGAAELLETRTAEVGQVIQDKPIVELPLNGRNFIQLATLAAGVYPVQQFSSCSAQGFGIGSSQANPATFTAMGLRESDVSYLVDGIETRGGRWGNATIRPSPDAIQEFKVQTDNYGADNGRSSIIVNIALKSGSDNFHGSAYEFLRNSALDANDFFLDQAHVKKPGFQQNDFGFSIGGPIVRHKTFFFGDYEGIRSLKSLALLGLYPSAAQLAGNLADDSAGTGIFPTNSSFCQANLGSSKCVNVIDPSTGKPFPGNQIPSNRLDPIAQKWLPYINTPNVAIAPNQAVLPAFNFTSTPKELNNADMFNVRIDHELGVNDHLFGSYSFDQRPHFVPGLAILGGENFPWRAQVVAVSETHVFTPTVVNELRFGYSRSRNAAISQAANGPNIAQDVFGFKNIPDRPIAFGVPAPGIVGFSCGSGGPYGTQPIGSYPVPACSNDQVYQFVDNLSITHGKHSFKLGGSIFHEKFFYLCDCLAIPAFSFTGQFTGQGLSDFLLGIPYNVVQSVGEGVMNTRANFYAGYFDDTFQVRPDLTLNLGVRYQYQQSPQEINGREETFLPSTGQVEAVFRNQIRNGLVNPDYKNWAPRIGLAYSPFRNTVIRSSFGIFYATGNLNEFGFAVFGPDFIVDQTLTSNPTTPSLFLNKLFPAVQLGPQNIGPNIGILGVDPTNRTPYVQEWSFDVQHTFGSDWLVDVGYAGNVAQHLQQRRDDNTPSVDPTGTIPIGQRRPFPNYNFILTTYNGGWSSYNGLLAKLEKKVTTNGFMLASYTWAKAIDLFNPQYNTIASRDFKVYDRGNSLWNVPQRFSLAYNYSLPIGKGMHFWSGVSGFADKLVSGWSVSGVTTFQSGQYITPLLPFDYVGFGPFSSSLPELVGPVKPAHRTITNWWNSSAYALPGCPSLAPCPTEDHIEGNARKGSIEGPGLNNWDISAAKNTALTERVSLQFRAELFDAWNHPQFGMPNSSLIPGVFGVITHLQIPPREVQFGLKLLF